VRARCFAALLLVFSLSAALFCAPAGSAMQAQVSAVHEQVGGEPTFKEGGSSGGSSGDDDRWGNSTAPGGSTAPRPMVDGPRPSAAAPAVSVPAFGLRIEIRFASGLVIFVVTPR